MSFSPESNLPSKPDFVVRLLPGQRFGKKYVLREATSGAGWPIWQALDEETGSEVSLHFLPDTIWGNEDLTQRLSSEVKAAGQLVHESLLRVRSVVEEDMWLAIEMDAFEEALLSARLERKPRGFFHPSEIRHWLLDLARTLAEMHQIGLLHGGLAPDCILVGERHLRLLACELTHHLRESVGEFVDPRILPYLSPQRLAGQKPEAADDVFAFGAIAYRLLTGEIPFRQAERMQTPPRITEWRAARGGTNEEVPEVWEIAIASCLAQDAAARPVGFASIIGLLTPVEQPIASATAPAPKTGEAPIGTPGAPMPAPIFTAESTTPAPSVNTSPSDAKAPTSPPNRSGSRAIVFGFACAAAWVGYAVYQAFFAASLAPSDPSPSPPQSTAKVNVPAMPIPSPPTQPIAAAETSLPTHSEAPVPVEAPVAEVPTPSPLAEVAPSDSFALAKVEPLPLREIPIPKSEAAPQLSTPPKHNDEPQNTLGMRFAPIPGTNVRMSIWLTRVKDFAAYSRATGFVTTAWKDPGLEQGPEHPVVKVSWHEANAFCRWLTDKERSEGRLPPDQSYRLPTDVEWSQAVGLGGEPGDTPEIRDMSIADQYPWGEAWPPPEGAGNFNGEETNSATSIKGYRDGFRRTSPVASFQANRHGLYDMGGNVWQWCADSWNDEHKLKVLRGASWSNGGIRANLLSSCRTAAVPESSLENYGFRIVIATDETVPVAKALPIRNKPAPSKTSASKTSGAKKAK